VTEPPSDRIRLRRNAKKGRYERERIDSILDRGLALGTSLKRRLEQSATARETR